MEVAYGRKPSALIPVAMSLAALLLVGLQLALHGMRPEADEGALAHGYQLLVAAQLPVIACFAWRWWRRAPRQGMPVLVAQGLALTAALAPVYLLGW
ncbi:MAG: hypothetical protein KGN16_19100 [Burkholderiales bacterium]|nr:hypothetical protein [Burkholderiales bacterium]